MSYQKQAPAERIILQSKPHWIILVPSGLVTLVGLACVSCTLLTALADPPPGQPPPPESMIQTMVYCSTCVLAVAMFWVISKIVEFIRSQFTVTNRRVIYERAGWRSRSWEIFLKHVDTVYVETSVLGYLFGYGNIKVTAHQLAPPFQVKLANAEKVRAQIQEQVARQIYPN